MSYDLAGLAQDTPWALVLAEGPEDFVAQSPSPHTSTG
jgi:hypothetical protein